MFLSSVSPEASIEPWGRYQDRACRYLEDVGWRAPSRIIDRARCVDVGELATDEECLVNLGFENIKDVLDVLLVPVSVGLLALLWPALTARKRRKNFEYLIRRELEEADPETENLPSATRWHGHLTRRFLHEEIISHPVENSDFVLSLDPRLAYSLSQMWIAFDKGRGKGVGPSKNDAEQWCWHLKGACQFLDSQGPRTNLIKEFGRRWRTLRGHTVERPSLMKQVWEPWRAREEGVSGRRCVAGHVSPAKSNSATNCWPSRPSALCSGPGCWWRTGGSSTHRPTPQRPGLPDPDRLRQGLDR